MRDGVCIVNVVAHIAWVSKTIPSNIVVQGACQSGNVGYLGIENDTQQFYCKKKKGLQQYMWVSKTIPIKQRGASYHLWENNPHSSIGIENDTHQS